MTENERLYIGDILFSDKYPYVKNGISHFIKYYNSYFLMLEIRSDSDTLLATDAIYNINYLYQKVD